MDTTEDCEDIPEKNTKNCDEEENAPNDKLIQQSTSEPSAEIEDETKTDSSSCTITDEPQGKSPCEASDCVDAKIQDKSTSGEASDSNETAISDKLQEGEASKEETTLCEAADKIESDKLQDKSSCEDSESEETAKTSEDKESSKSYDPSHIKYIGDVAVYTEPKSGYQYKWDTEKDEWVPHTTYGFEDDTHTYTDAEGIKFFWDKERNAWFPKIDDEFMANYQMNYGNYKEEPKPEKPEVVVKPVEEVPKGMKRKPSEPTWFELDSRKNTKVYVSNLPLDITEDEFVEMMQKCGIIMRDIQNNKLKIKLYTEPGSTEPKGDALCSYVRVESVELALKLLDGMELRGKKIHVERAKFQMKGAYDPKLKPKTKKRKEKEKLRRQQEKLFDWRPDKNLFIRAKHERVVVLKNVFESKMFDEDVGLILELQQDLREECSKCGDVRKVIIYDRHPEGVAQVNMKEPEEADACVALLNGRWFGMRKLTAEIWDGRTKFKIAETDSQISQRIDEWEKFLEEEDATKKEEKEVVNAV